MVPPAPGVSSEEEAGEQHAQTHCPVLCEPSRRPVPVKGVRECFLRTLFLGDSFKGPVHLWRIPDFLSVSFQMTCSAENGEAAERRG